MITLYRSDIDTTYKFKATSQLNDIRLTAGRDCVYYLTLEEALRAVHNIARAGGKIID